MSFGKRFSHMKIGILGLLMIITCFLAGCGVSPDISDSPSRGIWATNLSTSIGSTNEDGTQQVISYQITLKNEESLAVTIHSITLLFPSELDKRVLSDRKITVENTIEPQATIQINGKVTFDANGVSKTQISDWGPLIKGIFATMEQSVFIQSQETK
jgi:hypothetical protein